LEDVRGDFTGKKVDFPEDCVDLAVSGTAFQFFFMTNTNEIHSVFCVVLD